AGGRGGGGGRCPAGPARWRPAAGAWSIVEIVCHLADEEVEDFRARLRSTLEDPARVWAPIDPEGAARERGYQGRDVGAAMDGFARERAASVAWLRSLRGAEWGRAYAHPTLGTISAASLLASWSVHDALHLRQIAKRLYEMTLRDAGDASVAYAGGWSDV
ncbi:MAG: DinB family protein, partial [Phycisphaerales bacterium]